MTGGRGLIVAIAAGFVTLAAAQPTGGWLEVDYSALVDTRQLSHSGEPVGGLLRRLDGRPLPVQGERPEDRSAHSLLGPLLEPYAFVLEDALDSLEPVPDPPMVEVGALWRPGEAQPAWAELLRSRRYVVQSDGRGGMRLFLPWEGGPRAADEAAEGAYRAAWPVLRHLFAAERRRLAAASSEDAEPPPLELRVHPYVHFPERSVFLLGRQALRVSVDDTRPTGQRPPLDLDALRGFLGSNLQLEGGRLEPDGSLKLLGSRVEGGASLLGRPIELADFAVAYRAVFRGGLAEPYMSLDRAFSPWSSIVNYGGRLRDTSLGWVSLLCDIRFKTFSLGLGIGEGEDLRERIRRAVPGFMTHMERMAADPRSQGVFDQRTRLWFYPDNVDLTVSPQGDVLAMRRARMTAASERVGDESLAPAEGRDPPWTRTTIEGINRDYGKLAGVFPELADLDQVVRLLSFFTWLREARRAGLLVPDLDLLLALELPELATPRTFPQLLSFNALAPPGEGGSMEVFDQVPVGDALERLNPARGAVLPPRRRLERAAAALDPGNRREAALLEQVRNADPAGLDEATLDLLAYRAERLRMHRTVLATLSAERAQGLIAREERGEELRIFSIGIGGLDLGMSRALKRAGGRSLGIAAASQSRRQVQAPPRPAEGERREQAPAREEWRADPPSLPHLALPAHGPGEFEAGRIERGEDGSVWTVLGPDGPELVSRRAFVGEDRRARRIERAEGSRFWSYRMQRDGSRLRAVRVDVAPEAAPTDFAPEELPSGAALLEVRAAPASEQEPPTLAVVLHSAPAGFPVRLENDFPRPILQRLVMRLESDLTSGGSVPGLAPLPASLGPVEALLVVQDAGAGAPPWRSGGRVRPGEEDPARLARALNAWWRAAPLDYAAAVATDPARSPGRWSRAPRSGGGALLLLPEEGFPRSAAGLREELASAWTAGGVVSTLPSRVEPDLVVLVSQEPPAVFARRLRRLSREPAMKGKLLAAWCLSGPVRPDLPASILAEEGLAGLGLAEPSVVAVRAAPRRLGRLATALRGDARRVEQLPGPFVWFY